MSENPLYHSGNQKSKPYSLKPALSSALASLEVQLDEELARYRRTRIAHRTPSQKSLGNLIAAQPQDKISTVVGSSQNQRSLTGEQAAAYIRQQQASSPQSKIKTPPPPPPMPETSPGLAYSQDLNPDSNQAPKSEEQSEDLTEVTQNQPTLLQNQATSLQSQTSIVKADINQSSKDENLSAPTNETTKEPDDYLESSEALLRSLAEEQPNQTSPAPKKTASSNNDSLLSPLSIGSMLLLLVSSITFGYIVFNLDNPSSWSLGGLFKRNQEVQKGENTKTASNVKPTSQPKLTPIPKNPNLASDALPDINSIDDVAGATPKAKPAREVKPANPVTSQNNTTQTNTVPAQAIEQIPPTAAPAAPVKPVPQTEAAPTPQNLDDIEPSANGYYNIIVDNEGDAFTNVRKVVPDAYLSPEGKYVYLGAFKSKARVKKQLELLKKNGITARVEEAES